MKLCLGTVQFGLDYGILNQKKPSLQDAVKCIDFATQNGVSAIDTAKAYGNAEEVVGEFLKRRTIPRERLFLSTKLLPNILDDIDPSEYERVIESEILSQLKTLNTDYFDAYLFHSSRYAYDGYKLEAMHKVVEKGYARKCGVSVYEPEEAVSCYKSGMVDFIQVPYSIFDHRMKVGGVFDHPQRGECEIHSRSAFIQGLIVMDEEKIPPFLEKARPIVKMIKSMCENEGISRTQLAIQYVKRETGISHLVFGIDSMEQLKEDIRLFNEDLPMDLIHRMGKEFDEVDADIVMPSLWKR